MAYNIKLLDWDTANFGFGVAELAYDGIFNFNLGDIRSYLATTYPEVKLLYIKTSKKIDRSNIFCDEKITYVKHHQGTNYEAYLNIESNKNKIITTDLYELAILSGKFSRYNLDVKFPKKSFRHLYMKWIENSVYTEFATDVLVYKYNSKIIGFLTYKDSNDISSIGIISVNPKFQGLGIGSKLMSHYQSLLKPNIKLQTVVTQGCNIKARTLYEKNGYGILDRTYTYHLWV